MGKFNIGILGGVSGKVGPVVGADWNGIPTVRAYQPDVRNPQTAEQTAQRQKFTVVIAFIRVILSILRIGFKNFTDGISPYAKAISIALTSGVKLVGSLWEIDYPNFTISQGCLLEPDWNAMTYEGGESIGVSSNNNAGQGNALGTDVIHCAVYNSSKNLVASDSTSTRADGDAICTCPVSWFGDTVYVYVFAVSADGKLVCDSHYAGTEVLTA